MLSFCKGKIISYSTPMNANPVGWFEVPVTNMDRAEKFYKDFFGFSFEKRMEMEGGYLLSFFPSVRDAYGAPGALMLGTGYTPSHHGSILYFTAPQENVRKAIEKVEQMGVPVILPRKSIGENGYIAWIEDSEGNAIALHSMKD